MDDDPLPKEQVEQLQKVFETFDKDNLGYITEEIDEDGSGQIEFEEFLVLAKKFMTEDEDEDAGELEKELKEAFRLYDKEGQGYITTDVLKTILAELDSSLSNDDLDGMIEEIDEDGSGTVDFDEFMEMMTG